MERAISLLGNRTQQELKEKARQELIELINAYPDASTAANWKKNLRQLSKNPDDDDALPQSDVLCRTLLRQALLRVDWCIIGNYLIQKLSLKFPHNNRN